MLKDRHHIGFHKMLTKSFYLQKCHRVFVNINVKSIFFSGVKCDTKAKLRQNKETECGLFSKQIIK